MKIGTRNLLPAFAGMLLFGSQSLGAQGVDSSFERDRQAILAMAGSYNVTFSFRETVALAPGYEVKEDSESLAREVVFVIQDDGDFISLQHILLVSAGPTQVPIKHWRQDWVYEPAEIFDFVGENTFERRLVPPEERRGAWAQLVYQVDDSPRYAAVARWTHDNGVSTWESPTTWRPLPRRDETTRDDYDVLVATNRHVITPWGWVHEQDNSKLALRDEKSRYLVREIGVNTYRHGDNISAEVASSYWTETEEYWSRIRDEWRRIASEHDVYRIALDGETVDLYTPVLELADQIREEEIELAAAVAEAREALDEHVHFGRPSQD